MCVQCNIIHSLCTLLTHNALDVMADVAAATVDHPAAVGIRRGTNMKEIKPIGITLEGITLMGIILMGITRKGITLEEIIILVVSTSQTHGGLGLVTIVIAAPTMT